MSVVVVEIVAVVLVPQSYLTLYNPMDCSPQGSSVHGTLQARILEWVAIHFSRGSSPPRNVLSNPDLLHCRQMLYHLSHIVKSYTMSDTRDLNMNKLINLIYDC